MLLKIVTAIIAVADTVKIVREGIELLVTKWIDKKIEISRKQRNNYEKNRAILIKKMQEAESDEEITALSIAIDNLNHGRKQVRQ